MISGFMRVVCAQEAMLTPLLMESIAMMSTRSSPIQVDREQDGCSNFID